MPDKHIYILSSILQQEILAVINSLGPSNTCGLAICVSLRHEHDRIDECDVLYQEPLSIRHVDGRPMNMSFKYVLALFACLFFQANAQQVSNHAAPHGSPSKALVLLVSIDGFRHDYIHRGLSPNLLALAETGAHAKKFEPVFPSITFPNHYSQVTGLYPDHNGVVNNTMYDPSRTEQVFKLSDRNAIENPLWWDEATPLWVTLEQQGKIASTLFWVGSEAENHGMHPNDWLPYDNKLSSSDRAQQLLRWLARPDRTRADFATLYFSEVDAKGHEFGPTSPEVNAAIANVDHALGELLAGLQTLGLRELTTIVITSDHGMAQVTPDHAIDLSVYAKGVESAKIQWTGPLAGYDVNTSDTPILLNLLKQDTHMSCWAKEAMPAQYHFGTHRRIPTVVCLAQPGWSTIAKPGQKVIPGQHGYDPSTADMQGLFIAQGPHLKVTKLDTVKNIDIYNLLVRLLKVTGEKNDGEDQLYDQINN